MFSAEQLLDRGRLLIGALLVVPFGVLLPGVSRPAPDRPAWTIGAVTANPISAETPTARDVLANLTNPTVTANPAGGTSTAPDTGASSDEVGSESADQPAQPTTQIPGTAPDPSLAARLRQSQSRFTTPAPATPTTPTSGGPTPFAAPVVASYPTPPGAPEVFPVVGGASFANDWGAARPGGRSHQGIDLFAKIGTPIIAISDGTLFKVGWNPVGGWRFWLRDRWGNEFYHAHLSAFAPTAKEGAAVKAGTVIGFVGNSGDARTTPPHVHFEIHPSGGDPVPPFPYVSAWPRL